MTSPHRIGPHGIDLDAPRGTTRNRINSLHAKVIEDLKQAALAERAQLGEQFEKQIAINRSRAALRARAGQ